MQGCEELLDATRMIRNLLMARATGGNPNDEEYRRLRQVLLGNPRTTSLVPPCVRSCRDFEEFWGFIKTEFVHYEERRQFIRGQFRPLFDALEGSGVLQPADKEVSDSLERFDVESVHRVWTKALERRAEDPEGAITLARTLLESVCKHILDARQVSYDADMDLPKLYRLVTERLNLAPSQHSERVLRQILGGCAAVVEGLGALRNRLGDAHGQGQLPVRPAPRYAQLAVNLAGAMAMFLVETWDTEQASGI